MNIVVKQGLPFVSITIRYRGNELLLERVLLDTGSAGTIFNANLVRTIGVFPEGNDVVDSIRGVGGVEYVYTKYFESIHFDDICLENFQVEIGNMDYGMEINGIIGFDFISAANLLIDTKKNMSVYQAVGSKKD
jgi:hypothetical protein